MSNLKNVRAELEKMRKEMAAKDATSMNCRRTAESMWNSLRSRSDSLSPWSATAREGKISSIVRVL